MQVTAAGGRPSGVVVHAPSQQCRSTDGGEGDERRWVGGREAELRSWLLLEVAASPAPAAVLVGRVGPAVAAAARRRAGHRALRSLERDGLVVAVSDSADALGGGAHYRLSAAGEERFRDFAELLDGGLLGGDAAGFEPRQEPDRPARYSASSSWRVRDRHRQRHAPVEPVDGVPLDDETMDLAIRPVDELSGRPAPAGVIAMAPTQGIVLHDLNQACRYAPPPGGMVTAPSPPRPRPPRW